MPYPTGYLLAELIFFVLNPRLRLAGRQRIRPLPAWWATICSLPVFCLFAAAVGFIGAVEWTLRLVYAKRALPTGIRASGFGWSAGSGRIVSIAGSKVTPALAALMGVAHAIQVSALIWISLFVGYLISRETAGLEIEDRVSLGEPLPVAVIPGQEAP